MTISFLITAYKEPKTLSKQLQTILYQLSRMNAPWEILVCAPDPKTQRVVLEYQKINPCVKLIRDRGIGKPAALNLAFKEALGDIWILTDGDVLVDKKAIWEILKPLKNPKIGGVTGRPVSINSRHNMFGYWSHFLTQMAHQTRLKRIERGEQIDCSGYLYAIRGNLVKKIPENTLADDALISALVAKQGYKITYTPKAKVYVQYPDNFRDWIKQKKRSTGGLLQIPLLLKKLRTSTVGATLCGRPGQGQAHRPAPYTTCLPRRDFFLRGCCTGPAPTKMRGFSKEASGIFQAFKFAKTLKEFWWTYLLIFARIILWLLIFWEIKIIKKPFTKMWQRVESTK